MIIKLTSQLEKVVKLVGYKPVKKESDCVSTGIEIVSCEKCISHPDLMTKNAFSEKFKKIYTRTLRYAPALDGTRHFYVADSF